MDKAAKRRVGGAVALVAAGAVAGGILAGTVSASASTDAATTSASGTSPYAVTATNPPAPGPGANPHSSTPVRSDEKALSAADAATIKAKALAAVPGGTVYRIETDAGDAKYEAHMTKADGTEVTVKFDASLNVIRVESGMGLGDPMPAGGHGGPPPAGGTGGQSG